MATNIQLRLKLDERIIEKLRGIMKKRKTTLNDIVSSYLQKLASANLTRLHSKRKSNKYSFSNFQNRLLTLNLPEEVHPTTYRREEIYSDDAR